MCCGSTASTAPNSPTASAAERSKCSNSAGRWCTVPRYPIDDAEDLLDACARVRQDGIVLKRLDARYVPGARSTDSRKVKTAAWRTDHGPRRLPREIRERIGSTSRH